MDPSSPLAYVNRLASYITDPSTIRVRTLEYFGRAPSISKIRKIQEGVSLSRRRKMSKLQMIDIDDDDDDDPQSTPEPQARQAFIPAERVADVARYFGIKYSDLIGKSRKRNLVDARATIAVLLVERGYTLTRAAGLLNRIDHSAAGDSIRNFPVIAARNERAESAYWHFRQEWEITAPPLIAPKGE